MEECEICGRKVENLYLIELEGAQMVACAECSKGAKVIEQLRTSQKVEQARRPEKKLEEFQIVENYGRTIRRGREMLGLPLKVLAEKINEKESTLFRVENEQMLPGDKLARKIEHELSVRLIAKEEANASSRTASKAEPLTLGDAAMMSDNKKQGV